MKITGAFIFFLYLLSIFFYKSIKTRLLLKIKLLLLLLIYRIRSLL